MAPKRKHETLSADPPWKKTPTLNANVDAEPPTETKYLSSSTTNSSCRLLDLPIEMFEAIMDALPSPDLLAFRLISSAVNEILLTVVRKKFFARRLHVISDRTSMEVLHQISKSDRFATCVRQVKFTPIVLTDSDELDVEPWSTSSLGNRTVSDIHDGMRWDELAFFERGLSDLLYSTFENFRRRGNSLSITFENAGSDDKLSSF